MLGQPGIQVERIDIRANLLQLVFPALSGVVAAEIQRPLFAAFYPAVIDVGAKGHPHNAIGHMAGVRIDIPYQLRAHDHAGIQPAAPQAFPRPELALGCRNLCGQKSRGYPHV